MKWIIPYDLFETKDNEDIKKLLKECIYRFQELFNYLNTDIVEYVELKSGNLNLEEYAPSAMFKNNIQSKRGYEDTIDGTIFNVLATSMYGKCSGLEFTDRNGIKIQSKFVVFTDDPQYKPSLNTPTERICPVPEDKAEILYLMINNYAHLMRRWQSDNVMYYSYSGKKTMAETKIYRDIIIDYCYYLTNFFKNGINLFDIDLDKVLNGLINITYQEITKTIEGYRYINKIRKSSPTFYKKLVSLYGDNIPKGSGMGEMGFGD
jgi:hypothetical protein